MDSVEYDPKTIPRLKKPSSIANTLIELTEHVCEQFASIPLGQYLLNKVDHFVYVCEKSFEWSVPFPKTEENGTSTSKDTDGEAVEQSAQNGFLNLHVPSHLVRPLPWIMFIPFLIYLRVGRMYINTVLIFLGYQKLDYEDLLRYSQRLRRNLRSIRYSGSRSIKINEKIITEKYLNKEIKMNVVCRIFSKWPLSLVVNRLRKLLNFFGIITLPNFHRHHSVNNLTDDKKILRDQKNDLGKVPALELKVLTEEILNDDSDSDDPDYEPEAESKDSDESSSEEDFESEDYEDKVTRRVSVTVQETIIEETEEESVNVSQDNKTLNERDSDNIFNYSANHDHCASPLAP